LGLLASAGGDGKVIVWQISRSPDGEDGIRVEPIAAVRNAHGVSDVNSVHWCVRGDGPKGSMLASCGDDGTVKVWRVAIGQ
jgi:WD40 repeat protein